MKVETTLPSDNFNGDVSEELVAGDLISVSDDSGNIQHKIVAFCPQTIWLWREQGKMYYLHHY